MIRLALALLVAVPSLAAPALGAAEEERRWSAPVRLVAPAAGEALVAGSLAVVEWEPVDDERFAALGFEEWEAFLSFSAGDYYAVRVTPHLDLALRRFTFEVPAVPAENARILLRFGDEVEETEVETPGLFSIVLDEGPAALGTGTPAGPAPAPPGGVERGEAARPGDPGVIAWVEGTRGGEQLAVRRAARPPAHAGDRSVAPGAGRSAALVLPLRSGVERPAVDRATREAPPAPRGRLAPSAEEERAARIPILELTDRRNE